MSDLIFAGGLHGGEIDTKYRSGRDNILAEFQHLSSHLLSIFFVLFINAFHPFFVSKLLTHPPITHIPLIRGQKTSPSCETCFYARMKTRGMISLCNYISNGPPSMGDLERLCVLSAGTAAGTDAFGK